MIRWRLITDELLECGITDPRVFKKKSNGRTKRVDITLATEMLSHAHSSNYDVAILVAGDEDYVPLVQEVKRMGKQVALWFFENGLSKNLRRECDIFLISATYSVSRAQDWIICINCAAKRGANLRFSRDAKAGYCFAILKAGVGISHFLRSGASSQGFRWIFHENGICS